MEVFRKTLKRIFAVIMVTIMLICAAPLNGFVGLDIGNPFSVIAAAVEEIISDTPEVVSESYEESTVQVASVSIPDLELIENYDGSWQCAWDENDEILGKYFYYECGVHGIPDITITFTDGSNFTGYTYEITERYGLDFLTSDNQSYDNPWGIGEHTATVEVGNYTGEYTVIIIENPIERIEASSVQIIDGVNCWTNTSEYWDEELQENVEVKWTCYAVPSPETLTVYYKDGRVETLSRDEYETDAGFVTNQNYDNPWTVGNTYTSNVYYYNFNIEYEVYVAENPIERIEVEDLTFTENTNGEVCTEYWDEENQVWVDANYFRYYTSPCSFTVYYKDGRQSETYNSPWDFYESTGLNYNQYDDQTPDNPWGAGTHTAYFAVGNVVAQYEVVITASPVANVTIDPVVLYEYVNGQFNDDIYYDEETGEEIPFTYFYYNISQDEILYTVFLSNGETFTGSDEDVYEAVGQYPCVIIPQDYHNRLSLGENTFKVELLGKEYEGIINILENPIERIEVEDITIMENTNGEICEEYWDEETNQWVEANYFRYYTSPYSFTVYYKDGRQSETYESWWDFYESTGLGYKQYDDQSPDNPWGAGTHTAYLAVGNVVAQYDIIITASPVANVTVEPVVLYEYVNGYFNNDIYYDEETGEEILFTYFHYDVYQDEIIYNVLLNDGETVTGTGDDIYDAVGQCPSVIIPQDYHNRLSLGENTFKIDLFGKEYEGIIKILENPIERIEIEDITYTENTNGEVCEEYWDEEINQWVETNYFKYYTSPDSFTVYFKDGRESKTYSDYWDFHEETGLDYIQYDDQSPDNPWGVGTHTAYFAIGNIVTEYNIVIAEDPIESIVMEPVSIMEGTNGYTSNEYWDDELDEWVETESYYIYEINAGKITVNYKDGTSHTYNNMWDLEMDLGYDHWFNNPQTFYNQWGVGIHEVEYHIGNYECILQVEITESPIERIEIGTVYLCEGKNGWNRQGTYLDEETGKEISYSYYHYELLDIDFDLKVILKDGNVLDLTLYEFSSQFNEWPDIETDQSYLNPWTEGEHTATFVALGKRFNFNVQFCDHKNSTYYPAVAPDCKLEGYEKGSYCSDCKTWYEGRDYISTIPHVDQDTNDICDYCEQSLSYLSNQSILGKFLFLTNRLFDENENAPDYTVFLYLWLSGAFREYYDEDIWMYTVPYDDYIEIADKIFANHSDMKEYFSDNYMFTDETEQTVSWYDGGFGDAASMELLSVYDHGNGKLTLQGILVNYGYEPEHFEGRDDYYIIGTDYRNQFGNVIHNESFGEIKGAYELTIQQIEDDVMILSFLSSDHYLLDGSIYEITDDGPRFEYNSLNINCGAGATVVSGDGLLTDQLTTFKRYEGTWYEPGSGFSFDIELKEGYELVSVTLNDDNGERVLEELSFGGYTIIPSGNATITVETKSISVHEHSFKAKETVQPTCTEAGFEVYRCSCGESYTETLPATGKHNSDTTIPAVAATCTATGLTEGKKCSVCGTITVTPQVVAMNPHNSDKGTVTTAATCVATGIKTYNCTVCKTVTKTETIPATGKHNSDTTVPEVKATYTKTGKTEGKKCSVCGKVTVAQKTVEKLTLGKVTGLKAKTIKIDKSSSVTLSWTKVTGAQKYEIYIKSGSKWKKLTTTEKTSYTVKKDGKKKALKANSSYEFKVRAVRPNDKVNGSYSKALKVKIVPSSPTLTLKAGSKQLTASWKSISGVSGYEVQYSTSSKMKKAKTVKVKKSAKKTTVKKLSKGKKYYVKMRAYKTVNGKNVYSSWSKVKSVKVK